MIKNGGVMKFNVSMIFLIYILTKSVVYASPTVRSIAFQNTIRYLFHKQKVDEHVYKEIQSSIHKIASDASSSYPTPVYAYTKASRLSWAKVNKKEHLNFLKVYLCSYDIAHECLTSQFQKELTLLDQAFENVSASDS